MLPRSDSWLLLKVQLGKTWLINRQPPLSPSCLPSGVINQGERLTFPSVVNPQTSKVWQQNGHWVLAHLGFLRNPPPPSPAEHWELDPGKMSMLGFLMILFAGRWSFACVRDPLRLSKICLVIFPSLLPHLPRPLWVHLLVCVFRVSSC